MKNKALSKSLVVWLALSLVLTMAAGISYFAIQQSLRQSANWPQAQMASDAAAALAAGKAADSLVPGDKADITVSQSPFLVVYDASGNAVASSGMMNGAAPRLPEGVLDYTAKKGEDRVTWMPDKNTRIAAVVVKVQGGPGGAVLAGRSLAEAEKSIDNIGRLILAAWAGCAAVLLAVCLLAAFAVKKSITTNH